MKMFGWIDRGLAVQAGFDLNGANQPIISMDNSTRYACGLCSYKSKFWNLFRQIAANPVGRILLYRLLVEIRRHDNANNGIAEQNIVHDNRRNGYRNILVEYGADGWWWSGLNATITFCNNPNNEVATVVNQNAPHTAMKRRELCIALFHEMLHWYHYLRDCIRANVESGLPYTNNANPILAFYFDINPNNPGNTWGNGDMVRVEEIRTILGVSQNINGRNGAHIVGFLHGDDLSENLFRCSLSFQRSLRRQSNIPMRYGNGGIINNQTFQNQILLAYNVARNAMSLVEINAVGNWPFTINNAVSP